MFHRHVYPHSFSPQFLRRHVRGRGGRRDGKTHRTAGNVVFVFTFKQHKTKTVMASKIVLVLALALLLLASPGASALPW
jgi:hypothetical protein